MNSNCLVPMGGLSVKQLTQRRNVGSVSPTRKREPVDQRRRVYQVLEV